MVDEAYQDKTEWIKKSIRTSAKVFDCLTRKSGGILMMLIDGQVQLRSCNHELCGGVLEHRTLQGSVNVHCLLFGFVKSIMDKVYKRSTIIQYGGVLFKMNSQKLQL